MTPADHAHNPSGGHTRTIAGPLLTWYDAHRRHLPWRAPPGTRPQPYHVWLSEVMLQQTTVATVKAFFEKFTALWPTVNALAAADQADVLHHWAGLGYYARARNLHKCARVVSEQHHGQFPDTEEALRALPGIGDYTAAAIAAIAFDRPAVVVDGNIERVMARLFTIETPLPAAKKPIKSAAAGLTPVIRPGDYAQALMDLGATICTPRSPKCLICPVRPACAAHRAGMEEAFPVKAPKKAKPTRRCLAFWIEKDGHVMLRRRPERGLLGGMLELPSTDWLEAEMDTAAWVKQAPVASQYDVVPGHARHTFTHFHLEAAVACTVLTGHAGVPEDAIWHPIEQIANAGLPTAIIKMVRHRLEATQRMG